MSDAVKPALHGRDHCPGGADPIPCLTSGLPWFYAEVSNSAGTTPSANSEQQFSMDPSFTQWATEAGANTASSTFALDQQAGTYAVKILENGLYFATIWAKIVSSSAPAPTAVGMIGMTGANNNIGGADRAPFIKDPAGTTYSSQPNRIMAFNINATAFTPPYFTSPAIAQNTGTALPGLGLTLLFVKVNDTLAINF